MSLFSKRAYAEGFFPPDMCILANRGTWAYWFDGKQNVIDSNWVTIDDWVETDEQYSYNLTDNPSDNDFMVQDFDSGLDDNNTKQLCISNNNQNCMEIKRFVNLQLVPSQQQEFTDTIKLINFYLKDIMKKRLTKWEETGLDRLFQPAGEINSSPTTENINNWFDCFKGKLKISEIRTISYTRDSDTDSDDIAECKGGYRNKVKNKNRFVTQYSYFKKIEAKKKYEVKRNKQNIKEYIPFVDSGSSRHNKNKINRKRLKKYAKLRKSSTYSTSSSSSEKNYRYGNSHLLNQTHISSDETDNSDPDDRILANVRKTHKDFVKPAVINQSEPAAVERYQSPHTACTLNQTRPTEPIVEFPAEPEQQLVMHNSNQCKATETEEDDSEEDIIFMSNKKCLRLYGKCFVEPSFGKQSLVLYDARANGQPDLKADDSSTDDGLFKPKNYKRK